MKEIVEVYKLGNTYYWNRNNEPVRCPWFTCQGPYQYRECDTIKWRNVNYLDGKCGSWCGAFAIKNTGDCHFVFLLCFPKQVCHFINEPLPDEIKDGIEICDPDEMGGEL